MARVITPTDLDNAKRLKAIYNAKKKELDLTQTKLADAIGMKQGAAAQYINGHIALNYNATIEFAKALRVDPWAIDPTLNILSGKNVESEREVVVDVIATLSGSGKPRNKTVTIRYSGMTEHLYGYEADSNDFAPFLKTGDVAIVDRLLQPEVGDDVVVVYKNGAMTVGELSAHSARHLEVKTYADERMLDEPINNILRYDVVVSVKKHKKAHTRRINIVAENA